MEEEEEDEEEEDFNFDDFLKNGGVDLERHEEEQQQKEQEEKRKVELKRSKSRDMAPRNDMEGLLYKQSVNMSSQNLLGGIYQGVKSSLGYFANHMYKQRSERYFAIKKGVLYWYESKDSRKAQNDIVIKDIKSIEYDDKSKTVFYIIHKHKCYKLEGKTVISA